MKDFIGIYPDIIESNLCNELIKIIDQSSVSYGRVDAVHRQDYQLSLESTHPGIARDFMERVNNCLSEYIRVECPFLQQNTFVSSVTLVQKTEPMEGYHSFHAENTTWDLDCRSMAWMVYLNDVEEGGETEWLYQQVKVKPQQGTVVIWPAGYTHMHRGNPPMEDKYIATVWWQMDLGTLQSHILKQPSQGAFPSSS